MNQQTFHRLMCVLLVAAILALPISTARAETETLPDLGQFIDDHMRAQMDALHIPNAAVAVVSGDEVLYLQGYGYADLEEQIPVEAEATLFRVGSVSKLFTWTAVMQLVEQGKLDLNADVNQSLDFEIPDRLLGSEDAAAPITLRHLMTHTAGFEAYPDEIFRLEAADLLPLGEYVRTRLPVRVFPLGEVPAYSNYGAALAGYIVERVSGQPFAEYVEQHIFAPLKMGHSTFHMPAPADLSPSLARPYRWVDGRFMGGEFEYMQAPEGGLSSSAADMAKFMRAWLQGGRLNGQPILQPESVRRMTTSQARVHPELGGMTLGFMEGEFNGRRVLFHGGATMIFNSGLYLLPEENIGIFVAYSGANHLVYTELFQAFLDRYYPAPEAPVPEAAANGAERARVFAGEYHQNTRSFSTDEKFNSLNMGVITVAADEDGSLLITHVGETNRFAEVGPGVYRNLREGRTQDYFGPFRTVVFTVDPFGQALLVSDGPMSYSRAPWYATSTFTLATLAAILFLMVGTLIAWGLGALVGRLRGVRAPVQKAATAARMTAMVLAVLTVVFILSVIGSSAPDPVYGLPGAAFGEQPAGSAVLDRLPWVLAGLAFAVAGFGVFAWVKGFWRPAGRIHYTVLSAAALGLVWVFVYWNVL